MMSKTKSSQKDSKHDTIKIIEDPHEALKIAVDLIESAKNEILVMFYTPSSFYRQEKMGTIDRLKKMTKEKNVLVRILIPKDDLIKKISNQINKEYDKFNIRFTQPVFQSKISILIVDQKYSLVVELKDDSQMTSHDAMGISTYSSSKASVLSYVSIFESLWSTLELYENIKESNMRLYQSNFHLSMTEKKYRNLYENSPSMLRSIDTNGILIDCNKVYAKTLGYSKEEAIGMSIYDHTADRSIEDLRNDFKKWKTTRQISHIEIWMKRKDGIIFPTLLSGTSLFDDQGNLIGRTVALMDVTEIHKARQKIEERETRLWQQYRQLERSHELLIATEKKYKNLYENSPSLLRSITTEGVLTDCNKAYAYALGYSKEEAIGMSIYDHTADRSMKIMRENLEEWRKTQIVPPSEIWLKRKDDSIFPALLTGTSLFDEHGNLIGRTLALTDLTEIYKARQKIEEREARLKEQFEELKILNKKLENQDKMQKEFINAAAHELRTPIQPIIGLAEVLRNKEGDISSQISLIDIIIKSGKRLQRIAENILDVTKIESNTLKINKEKINLRELLYDLFQDFQYHLQSNCKEKDVQIQFHVDENIFVIADRARLTQVMTNLFYNALKFTDRGIIVLSVEKTNGNVLIKVKDTGTGMSDAILTQLFTKFAIKSETGTGLGLFISKNIVEAHGGTIWAENNKEENGATFAFTIPYVF